MSISIRRGLPFAAIMLVVVGALLLNVGVSSPTEAQSLETQTSTAPAEAGAVETVSPGPEIQQTAATSAELDAAEARIIQAAAAGENGLIAFESNQRTQNPEGDFEIFAMNPDGTGLTNLTNNTTPDTMPAWSADGGQLAFTCNRNNQNHICKMNADGSNPVQLTFDFTQSHFNPTWSPDGTKIAYSSTASASGAGNIYVMNANGTERTLLTNSGTLPDWSPVNNQIAFVSGRDGNFEIYKMNADGSAQTRLTKDISQSQEDTAPAWSPDGEQIVFQSNGASASGRIYEIYKMNAKDGSGETRLTNNGPAPVFNGIWDFAPDWSPDGNQIVFQANRTMNNGMFQNHEIFIMNADGSAQKNLTNTADTLMDRNPDWQPLLDNEGPAPVENFAATAEGSKVSLSWTNPTDADFAVTRILRSTSGFATDPEPTEEQTQVYEGTATSHSDVGLTYGTPYHYTAFARDNAGNWSTAATASATIGPPPDTTPPMLSLPNDMTVEATDSSGAKVSYDPLPTATDEDPANPEVSCTPSSGDTFALGQTTVNCSATDAAENKAEGTFKVTVVDTTGPSLDLPQDKTVEATSAAGAEVTYNATATDLVDGTVDVNCAPASGSTFSLGETAVNCSALDAAGNPASGSFKVTVQDTTAPVISGMPSDITEEATSSAGTVVNYTKPVANDAVDPSPVVTCSPAPGSTFPVGPTTVSCTTKDASGNESAAETFKVNVAYGWSNFLQPINVTGAQSIFKIGSTVPVKFKLTGDSAGIADGNFYLRYIRTGNGDGQGEVETVATATGNTGTQFRYDATAGQYIFNWSTKSISASQAGNYEVRVYTDSAFTNLLGSVSIELKK